jgi:Ser/Thr protein kinase RdoA (MazF antagonist)
MESAFKQRIGFSGDLKEIAEIICKDFILGNLIDSEIVPIGYEDFNFSLETSKGKFFVKIFSKVRTPEDCERNVDVVIKALEYGVSVPKLYKSKQGYLHVFKIRELTLRSCVMDFISGKNFYTSKKSIKKEDRLYLARQAALINSINIRPPMIYDSWAITNLPNEFEKKGQYLNKEDLGFIKPLVEKFNDLNIKTLPHCFVHGDITRTNTIKDKDGKIWIVDFSVANYYPRIQEIALFACELLFNKDNEEEGERNLKEFLKEYQKTIKLEPRELEALPTYIKFAHAMHVLLATYEKKVNNNNTEENEYFLSIGKAGLQE